MPRIKDLDVGSATGAQLVANSSDDEAILVEASDFATAAQGTKADSATQPGDTHAAGSKTTPVDADEMPLQDSEATYGLKKLTWANLKATLKTYLDTLYQPVDADLTSIAGLSPSNDDIIQRKSGSWANRTMAQLLADLAAFVGDSGSGGTKGLVPAPGTGDATKYLKGDGTWDTPAGGGGGGSGDVVGPASSTAGNFASYDDTTGKLLEDSGVSASSFQTANSKLTDIAGLAVTDGNIIVGNGTTWVAESGATARTSLGVGTGDSPQFTGVNIGHASDTTLTRSAAGVLAVEGTVVAMAGKQAIPIPAGAMKATTTNGAASGSVEMTTNKNMVVTLDFDASTQEFAQFSIPMPKSWNESTVTFVPHWSHASTTTNFGVVWQLQAVAVSNDDALDVAFGTAQTSTDTGGTTNDYYAGPESSAITIAGTPAENDLVMFQVARVPANGSDTMAIDARLHGITLFITTDAGNDA